MGKPQCLTPFTVTPFTAFTVTPFTVKGKLAGIHSVSINLSYRITLDLLLTEHEIVPINVGGHEAVY